MDPSSLSLSLSLSQLSLSSSPLLLLQVYWSDSGELVCMAADESYFILKYNPEAVQQAMSTNQGIDEDGVEAAFDVSVSACP